MLNWDRVKRSSQLYGKVNYSKAASLPPKNQGHLTSACITTRPALTCLTTRVTLPLRASPFTRLTNMATYT
ncbi:hypothetical protein E2C01_022020 [Portunus trituberculatus]|uniref:Uncharacterized protein n=1 Tax=Portunus trituberculatus TaxID=210409 RepID=A0A5B7E5X2_PORTR|nr:hypothetical protein [Portunus trituberculatus]